MDDSDRIFEPNTTINNVEDTDPDTTESSAYNLRPITGVQYSAAAILEAITTSEEPNLQEGLPSPEQKQWLKSIQNEFEHLHRNRTWKRNTPTLGIRPLPSVVILMLKRDSSGRLARFKGLSPEEISNPSL